MPISVSNVGMTLLAINQATRLVTYRFEGRYTGNSEASRVWRRFRAIDNPDSIIWSVRFGGGTQFESGFSTDSTGHPDFFTADYANYGWRSFVEVDGSIVDLAPLWYFKAHAIDATSSVPQISGITTSGANVSVNYFPNTLHSTSSAQIQYKLSTEVQWHDAGSAQAGSGYIQKTINAAITGLLPSTTYNVRLLVRRTTVNAVEHISTVATFTTLAGEPQITTGDATANHDSATLNATLAINSGAGVSVYFKWDTVSPPVANITTPQTATASGVYTQQITGLTQSTTYYFQAFVEFATPAGSPNEGSVVSFTTPGNPAVAAASEDHVFIREFEERKYGVASKFIFPVASPAATSSDRFFNAASPFVAGDIKVAKDTGSGLGAFADVGSLPTRIGSTAAFELSLTAAEMQGRRIVVQIVDQNGPAFRDTMLIIHTTQELGLVDVDATQFGGNTPGASYTGVGTGGGIVATGGATAAGDIIGILGEHVLRAGLAVGGGAGYVDLDASANATDDYYNGSIVMIVGGTGAGQSRVITDYTGSSKRATVDSSWVVNPDGTSVFMVIPGSRALDDARGELSAIPADTASFRDKLQFIYQRFAFKLTQTATVQTMFKADNSTSLGARSVSDAAGTQTVGKIS